MKRRTFLFFLAVSFLGLSFVPLNYPQRNRQILVIPFSRFEFHTEIKLTTINEANGLSGDQFYPLLVNAITEAFELNSTERLSYKIIDQQDLMKISPFLKYELIPGKGHYTCDMGNLDKKILKEILDKYNCDNLLTLNWYRILNDKTSYRKKRTRKISLYSSHFIDYDVFTREGTIIKEASRVGIEVPADSSNIQYMGLRINDLKVEYKKLVDGVTLHIIESN